jgi:hypothetical protein
MGSVNPESALITAQIRDFLIVATQKFSGDSTIKKECAKQNAFQFRRKTFQMVHGAWRDSMTALSRFCGA